VQVVKARDNRRRHRRLGIQAEVERGRAVRDVWRSWGEVRPPLMQVQPTVSAVVEGRIVRGSARAAECGRGELHIPFFFFLQPAPPTKEKSRGRGENEEER
jgi:hypothetical protein